MTKRQRTFFRIGAWACIVCSGIHLAGQFAPRPAPANEAERTLFDLMTTYRKDWGAGFHRTTMDFVKGFSLTFSLFLLFAGVIAVLLAARPPQDAVLWRRLRLAYAIGMGILLAINVVYFFLPPLVCVAVIFLAFLMAALGGPEARPVSAELR
jgi:hypothetical protein